MSQSLSIVFMALFKKVLYQCLKRVGQNVKEKTTPKKKAPLTPP